MNRSRTITGLLALTMICAPILLAPFRLSSSLGFVRGYENRAPHAFPAPPTAHNLIDARWWSSVSLALEDRVPFRKQAISLARRIPSPGGAGRVSEKIALGTDNWLFYQVSLSQNLGTLDEMHAALGAIDAFAAAKPFRADLYLLAAPDKVNIYPEMLEERSAPEYESSLPQRRLLRAWFAQPDPRPAPDADPRGGLKRLDIWTPMLAAKARAGLEGDPPIYEVGGSHFTSVGAMVMARAMIDAIDPTLWDEGEIVDVWTKSLMPELAKLGGYWETRDTYTMSEIVRQGVVIDELWIGDARVDRIEDLPEGRESKEIPLRAISHSSARRLIPGKTLIIHDSFIGIYLRPTLLQFFADVRFMHFNDLTPESLREALDSYDRVYMETVERYFPRRAALFFGNE